jgi:holo-[acyl-carrier protein] synthase
MIVGLGIDVVETVRIARLHSRYGERFAARILTDEELRETARRNPVATLAKYFCVKEAAGKALGTGIFGPVSWHQIIVTHRASGRPELRFVGAAAARFAKLGGVRCLVSITDEKNIAAAVVVLEGAP